MDAEERFDRAYYQRFYDDPKTQVISYEEHSRLVSYVFSFAEYNDLRIRSVLDVGAGIGLWRRWLTENAPKVKYTGTEVSSTMFREHGYEQRDISRWRSRNTYDLVVCQGVLQYISDADLAPALDNLAQMASGLVYIVAMTRSDLRERCDLARSDTIVVVRNGSYYRKAFNKHFIAVGAGLHWPRSIPLPFWELDVAGMR